MRTPGARLCGILAAGLCALVAGCSTGAPSRAARPAALVPSAAVSMRATPPAALAFCRRNSLLGPVCPSAIPDWGSAPPGQQEYTCVERDGYQPTHGRALVKAFESRRCVFAEWDFEIAQGLPGFVNGVSLSGWDGRRWVPLQGASLLFPPPYHVHVGVQAWLGSHGTTDPAVALAHRATDALLASGRPRAVSLGAVEWSGHRGQLVLEPGYPNGGTWGDHLAFFFTVGRGVAAVHFGVSLHAWLARLRLSGPGGRGVRHLVLSPTPALPHVAATLEKVVASTALAAGAARH